MQTATEFDLSDHIAAFTYLHQTRVEIGMSLGDMEEKSGVSVTSFYVWKSGGRSPQLANLVALSQTLGFDVLISGVDKGTAFEIPADSSALWRHMASIITDAGFGVARFQQVTGISNSSRYSWERGDRSPTLGLLNKLGAALGLRVFLRKKKVSRRRAAGPGIYNGWHKRANRQGAAI